jgi:arylsulfatase A-like enzyme
MPGSVSEARPYRDAFGAMVGTALGAGLLSALVEALLTLRGAAGVQAADAVAFARIAFGLYLGLALVVGLTEGVVVGAVRATHGSGGLRRGWRALVADAELDRRLAAALVAGALAALVFALLVAGLAMGLVAKVERQSTGALLLGFVAVALVPLLAALWYPTYRVTRRLARAIPRGASFPATATLVVAGGAAALVLVAFVTMTRLDWRALPLGVPTMAAVFAIAQLALYLLFYGRFAAWRTRLPARGAIVVGVAILAALGPIIAVSGPAPSPRTLALLAVESRGARALVAVARRAGDHDGDGYSTLLGGGDCDDHDPAVNPGARDLPGNGKDENCNGADAVAHAAAAHADGAHLAADPGSDAEPPAFAWKGNVVIIAVDTLRADRLGAAGYRRDGKSLTPRIDALVSKGVYFTHAWAQAPHTPRSFPSLFTSRYPSAIHWDKSFSNYPRVEADNTTVFEAFHDAGYTVAGEASHFYFTAEQGITQGFDSFDNSDAKNLKDSNTDIAAPRIVPRVKTRLGELAAAKQKFVLFTHMFEPHSTYVEHEGVTYVGSGKALFEEKYDREVEFVDHYVGEIVDAVAAAGLEGSTMIVLVSDHGEAFFTHSYAGQKLGWHGSALYDDQLRVPIVFVAPGLAPRKVDSPVMLLDVAPTLLTMAGVRVPASFQGESLVDGFVGDPLPARPVHAELVPYPNMKVSLQMQVSADGKTKLIRNLTDRVTELYDLVADPGEQKNLAFDDAARARTLPELEAELSRWADSELSPP